MHESPLARTCPQCGQPLAADSETCANCGRDGGNPFTSPVEQSSEPKRREVDSALWITLIVVIVVCSAVSIAAPGLGVPLAMVFVPAVVRASAVMKRDAKAPGATNSAGQTASAIFASAGISIAVWMASAVAFAAVCTPAALVALSIDPNGAATEAVAFGLGGVAGLAVFFWFMRKLWPDVWPRVKDDDATA
jgi:Na+-driven multidrug efflux pump